MESPESNVIPLFSAEVEQTSRSRFEQACSQHIDRFIEDHCEMPTSMVIFTCNDKGCHSTSWDTNDSSTHPAAILALAQVAIIQSL